MAFGPFNAGGSGDAHAARHAADGSDPITLGMLGAASNHNLLDNWCFVDPIDQRGGYVVPPETPYYSDTELGTQAGTVSGYTAARYVDGVRGSITVNGTACYVSWSMAVRGYAPENYEYTVDRWWAFRVGSSCLLTADGIVVSAPSDGYASLAQTLPFTNEQLAGMTMTVSAIIGGDLVHASGVVTSVTEDTIFFQKNTNEGAGRIRLRYRADFGVFVEITSFAEKAITVLAAKLELGDTQTLARQDENGNWVLNDPMPNKALELIKCVQSTADSSDPHSNKDIYREVSELKTSVSEGKALIAAAVTDKGVATAADAAFQTMADNVGAIVTLEEGTADANAAAAHILSGKTAYVRGKKVTGTMTNQGAKTASLNCGASYTIPAGYHNGSGKVTANSLAAQTGGTATAAHILQGATAYVNGAYITGTIPVLNTQTITPTTYDQTLWAGHYLGGNQTVRGEGNLVAANIASGVSIFGVTGTAKTAIKATVTGTVSVASYSFSAGQSCTFSGVTAKYGDFFWFDNEINGYLIGGFVTGSSTVMWANPVGRETSIDVTNEPITYYSK